MAFTKFPVWYASTEKLGDDSSFRWMFLPFWPVFVSEDHFTVPYVHEAPVYYKDVIKQIDQRWIVGYGVRMKFAGDKDVTLMFMRKKDKEAFVERIKATQKIGSASALEPR